MEKKSDTSGDQESDSTLLEYDINDIKQSIQDTNKAIEKFAMGKEGALKEKKKEKQDLVPSNFNTNQKP